MLDWVRLGVAPCCLKPVTLIVALLGPALMDFVSWVGWGSVSASPKTGVYIHPAAGILGSPGV